jgi:hypothetical protein
VIPTFSGLSLHKIHGFPGCSIRIYSKGSKKTRNPGNLRLRLLQQLDALHTLTIVFYDTIERLTSIRLSAMLVAAFKVQSCDRHYDCKYDAMHQP